MTEQQTAAPEQELGICGSPKNACGLPCEPCEGKPDPAWVKQPAAGCDYCNHPLYAGTKCKNCGREQQPAAWFGLTDDEIETTWRTVETNDFYDCVLPLSRTIEAKLRSKNGGVTLVPVAEVGGGQT